MKLWSAGMAIAVTLFAHAAHASQLPADVRTQLPAEDAARLQGSLQNPVPGAPVTSGFGWRVHPTLHYTRFHAGVDFGGAKGTPVLAAGDAVVEKIVRTRDRGLYVVLQHDARLASGYAHLSAVAPGLTVGQTVRAGQRIGSVGRSGRASGHHLDLEIFFDGQRIDPALSVAGLGPETQESAPPPTGNSQRGKHVTFSDF